MLVDSSGYAAGSNGDGHGNGASGQPPRRGDMRNLFSDPGQGS
jgi:hypothetical protein